MLKINKEIEIKKLGFKDYNEALEIQNYYHDEICNIKLNNRKTKKTGEITCIEPNKNMLEQGQRRLKKNSNEYYNNLLVNTYKNKIASVNSDTLINRKDIAEYYDTNMNNFVLYEDIVQARYIRLNKNNFNINEKI